MATKKPKKGVMFKDYFLMGGLTEDQLLQCEKILRVESVPSLKKIINISADLSKRQHEDVTLLDPQTIPVALSNINKRFYIGDKPGLGKTVMSAAAYALYRKQEIEAGRKPKKLLLVTDTNHCLGMSNEMKHKFGVNLLPLINGTIAINRTLKKNDLSSGEFDGVVTSWGSVKSNGFLLYYVEHAEEYDFAIFDETSKLNNTSSQLYQVVDDIVNHFNGGISRVLFLNGSSFEKTIYDIYNQFLILNPILFPSKKFIDENYVIKGENSWWVTSYKANSGNVSKFVQNKKAKVIVDYKNQADLKKRIRHHFIARSKSDYSKVLPKYNYRLNVVEMSKEQRKMLESDDVLVDTTLLNSPTTRNKKFKFTDTTVPKAKEIVDLFEQVIEDRPILYIYNIEAQNKIKEMLEERGYSVGVLNGTKTPEEKLEIQEKFNKGKLDTLIFNIARAINIPASDRILFYDIPTMPQVTYQVQGRIDRNNYDQPKFYNFFVYFDSPEMLNMVRLACFREEHSSAFTGQETDVYQQLIAQLRNYIESNTLEDIKKQQLEETKPMAEEEIEKLFN